MNNGSAPKLVTTISMVPIAQWIARWTSNPEVVGSNPTGDDVFASDVHSTILFYLRLTSKNQISETSH